MESGGSCSLEYRLWEEEEEQGSSPKGGPQSDEEGSQHEVIHTSQSMKRSSHPKNQNTERNAEKKNETQGIN